MLKALVIIPNERIKDMGSILAIARAEAQKREHTHKSVDIKSIRFVSECQVYVVVYNAPDVRGRRLKIEG